MLIINVIKLKDTIFIHHFWIIFIHLDYLILLTNISTENVWKRNSVDHKFNNVIENILRYSLSKFLLAFLTFEKPIN